MSSTTEDKFIEFILKTTYKVLNKQQSVGDAVKEFRNALQSYVEGSGLLFDALVSLNYETLTEEQTSELKTLLNAVCGEVLPHEVLSADVSVLGAEDQQMKSRIVKSKTRLYYKQVKFNLFREECEGYAKLISELLSIQPNTTHDDVLLTVERLIGQFNLDPNRVVDVVLDCFENSLRHKDFFIHLLRKFKLSKEDLRDVLVLKFSFCKNTDYTTMSLYRVASILCQEQMIDLDSLFSMLISFWISPSQTEIRDDSKFLGELIRTRSTKYEIISSTSAVTSSDNTLTYLDDNACVNGPEAAIPSVSFSAALQSQITEDKKLASNKFDDSTVLAKNQKLGLVCSLLEHGNWNMAKNLLDRFPDVYPMGVCRRIAMAIANIVGFQIESFYRRKYPNYRNQPRKMRESWEKFLAFIPQVSCWQDLFVHVYPLLAYLGPYIGTRHDVAIKLIRLIVIFFDDEDAKMIEDLDSANTIIMEICDNILVPAASILESNYAYCEELWQILYRFTYQERFRIYERWRTIHADRNWDLCLQRGKVLGMTRYVVKRLSKETAKVMGRQLGKLSHTYPMVVFDYLLEKVQDFQNFIGPVVESIRFMSLLEFDVLSYCLIENLAAPEKQNFKISESLVVSPWLSSLAMFAAAVYRRYSIDFTGILQYLINQLKENKSMDLVVLREIVANISGVEHSDALLKNDLFECLCILMAQQKNFIIFRESKEYPLKLTTQLLDHSQETFVQFFNFLRTNLKPEEYMRRMPTASILITEYHMPAESAICLTRPIYMDRINASYELSKKNLRETNKSSKTEPSQKTQFYHEAFASTSYTLEEEFIRTYSESFWFDMTSKLYSTFWLLSVNDLSAPIAAYEREIEKCRKEISEIQQLSDITKSKKSSKDEERLKGLEQRLTEELRKQTEHVKRVEEILTKDRDMFFASTQNRSSQILRFLQSCIMPRAIFSEVDAIYCAKFVEKLHVIRTSFFQTIIFFDRIFNDVTPILTGLSERETACFGRFCNLILDLIMRWHSNKLQFDNECQGFPGCIIKIKKGSEDDPSHQSIFTFDHYRSICQKWHVRLAKSMSFMLTSNNYILIRNALTYMIRILPNFPVLQPTYKTIELNVATVRDAEKGKRSDLNLLASSYLVQLAKRNVRLWQNEEFHNPHLGLGKSHQRQGQSTGIKRTKSAAPKS